MTNNGIDEPKVTAMTRRIGAFPQKSIYDGAIETVSGIPQLASIEQDACRDEA